jgi:(4S)-4-hydroxy-5-phosphonooxypentane-2,3-dione isomerase
MDVPHCPAARSDLNVYASLSPILARIQHFRQHGGISALQENAAQQQTRANRSGPMLFVVVVEFHLKPGAQSVFRSLIDANADASVRNEPGCLQFDVLEPEGESDRVLLYEIYADKAAFDAHLKTEHFHVFNGASEGLCLNKSVTRCGLVFSGANVASKRAAD